MSYPKQASVAKRLHAESIKDLHAMIDDSWKTIDRRWRETRRDLRGFIMDAYRAHFGSEPWDMAKFASTGAAQSMFGGVHNRIEEFKHYSMAEAKNHLNDIYRRSVLRHAWVLDQTTPACCRVRLPMRFKIYEAAIQIYQGAEAAERWQSRWTAWTDAYGASLINNLRLGAINQSNMADSADEVDATRAGSPSYNLLDALNRIFESQAVYAVSAGALSVSNVNDDFVMEEIWQTVHDMTVCDICEPLDGLTVAEAGMPPEHPNCRCYVRLVPAEWAELLRSGDDSDKDLARYIDAQGLVPGSMVIRGLTGEVEGYGVVDFMDWIESGFRAIAGGV